MSQSQSDKVSMFMTLAGQKQSVRYRPGSDAERELGAQLLLSEVLEYIIDGLGVTPLVGGQPIGDANGLTYKATHAPDQLAAIDGLADTFYTMWWNALAFGIPLSKSSDAVCDNNLQKFVRLGSWAAELKELPPEQWHCRCEIRWPAEVVKVEVVAVGGSFFAVGKDSRGKVRKPSSYAPVDLTPFLTSDT